MQCCSGRSAGNAYTRNMTHTLLFQFTFDIATRPDQADSLISEANALYENIDALFNLTSDQIERELDYVLEASEANCSIDVNYELFLYTIVNIKAFARYLSARKILFHRVALYRKYEQNCIALFRAYLART